MPLPLNVAGFGSAREAWESFLAQRDKLVARMELATCDGCDGCGLRCMSGFTVTREEYEKAQAYLATRPAEEKMRVAGQEKTVPWPGAEDTGATVTFCRYRDREKNNCSIYPARPTVCRLFGHTPWLPCPTGDVTRFPSGSEALWRVYISHERRTFEDWDGLDASPAPCASEVALAGDSAEVFTEVSGKAPTAREDTG